MLKNRCSINSWWYNWRRFIKVQMTQHCRFGGSFDFDLSNEDVFVVTDSKHEMSDLTSVTDPSIIEVIRLPSATDIFAFCAAAKNRRHCSVSHGQGKYQKIIIKELNLFLDFVPSSQLRVFLQRHSSTIVEIFDSSVERSWAENWSGSCLLHLTLSHANIR